MLNQLLFDGLIKGAGIALLAAGFTVLYSGTRFFVFTYGASYTLAAYVPFMLKGRMPYGFAALIGLALGTALGVAFEWFVYRPIRSRDGDPLILMLASIGAYVVVQNGISSTWGNATQSVRDWSATPGHSILAARVSNVQVLIVLVSLSVLVLVHFCLKLTSVGRMLRAVANDPVLASVVGINVPGMILLATTLGCGMASAAGLAISLDTDLVPNMGFEALLLGVVAAIVGGVNSYTGAVLGGMFLGLAMNLGVWKLPTQWQDAIVFLILIIFLLFRPQGFLGKPLSKATV